MALTGRAYLLHSQVVHVRYLPSKHTFTYPTCSLLLSLNDLETGGLDLLRGRIFSFGPTHVPRLAGIRASAYLQNFGTSETSLREKLMTLLNLKGFNGSEFQNAWVMTIPSLFGIQAFNPVTAYFCYKSGSSALWLIVLEAHNTVQERHVYILDVEKQDKSILDSKFEYQWTVPRQFHVSPFNDRSGYYLCQIIPPSHPPLIDTDVEQAPSPGRPIVKLTHIMSRETYEKRFTAFLRVKSSTPLSTPSLLKAAVSTPFDFLCGLPRTLYQAYLLYYHKRIALHRRPEPYAFDQSIEEHLPPVTNTVQIDSEVTSSGGTVKWQTKNWIETWCERQLHDYLRRECQKRRISTRLVPANPAEKPITFHANGSESELFEHTFDSEIRETDEPPLLTIYYRSPRIFTVIFSLPSAMHGYLYGVEGEKIFSVSSLPLFIRLLEPPLDHAPETSGLWKTLPKTYIRTWFISPTVRLPIPPTHSLDNNTCRSTLMSIFIILMHYIYLRLETVLYRALKARFIEDPWSGWSGVEKRLLKQAAQR
ncbi:hypothetical protein Clacol_008481 [Clathrus columnatus]|uniref:Uncharacterized protein n=1 Tax=Clathrus columnatus TaxID=1419009 RepID=A0AAV5AHY3_9AGAM|nr:hypothetical protein Clacol_008481 [Clathrus columnatus]